MSILAYSHDGVTISVAFDRYVFDRFAWRYTVGETDGPTWHEDTDLETPEYDMPGALVSLNSLLSGWAESGPDWVNADLFPADMRDRLDWAGWCHYARSDLHIPGSD